MGIYDYTYAPRIPRLTHKECNTNMNSTLDAPKVEKQQNNQLKQKTTPDAQPFPFHLKHSVVVTIEKHVKMQ
jgi:hypothetical protein